MKPIRILQSEINQSGEAWENFRSMGLGGSDIGSVMGLNKYKSMRKLWQEKSGVIEPEFVENEAVKYGKHMEPFAIKEYQWETGIAGFEPCLFIHPNYSFARVSVDAYHERLNYCLEIKSPFNPKNIEHAARGKVDRKYWAQLQWVMFCSGTTYIDYCVYSGTKLWIKRVSGDIKYQRRMLRYAKWFWHQVLLKRDPKRRKLRHLEIKNDEVTDEV